MKFNQNNLKKLRKYIEEKIKDVPEGERIHIDKDLLDLLIFKKINSSKDKLYDVRNITVPVEINDDKYPFKIPVWTGDFLQKIDLSELSFDGVLWNGNYVNDIKDNAKKTIIFKNTNAKIDFSKAYYIDSELFMLDGCDFSGTLLINLKNINSAIDCNFSNCKLTKEDISISRQWFRNCNFSFNDLKGVEVKKENFNNFLCSIPSNEKYNFINCGIHFYFDRKQVENNIFFKLAIKDGRFDSCYLNEVYMLNNEEKKKSKERVLQKYREMEEKFISDIDEKINVLKKKKMDKYFFNSFVDYSLYS